jgi:hypothetical protein
MEIGKEIVKAKSRLIAIAKTKGISENFGQKEVRKLEERFIDQTDYSMGMNRYRIALQEFEDWCMNYCGEN